MSVTESLIERLRSPRNSLGKLALPKGLMERAVQDAWDKATSPVGDPADGIEMHDLAVLADAICDYLETALAAQPSAEPGLDWQKREPNHYDWFMPDDPTADVADYLDDFEAKLTEALTDFYVHDMAHSVLPLIAAYRLARVALADATATLGHIAGDAQHRLAALAPDLPTPGEATARCGNCQHDADIHSPVNAELCAVPGCSCPGYLTVSR